MRRVSYHPSVRAKRMLCCGNPRETLPHWTKKARPVMDRLRGTGG
jgi:hypothetical protein